MEAFTVDRLDPTNRDEAARIAVEVSRIIDEIRAEGQNMALPSAMTPEEVLARAERHGSKGGVIYALVREHAVAFGFLSPSEGEENTAVLGVWVLPEFRRRGIGMEISRYAIEIARENGYTKLHGTIPGDNEPALSFFSAVGPIAAIEGGNMRYELPV